MPFRHCLQRNYEGLSGREGQPLELRAALQYGVFLVAGAVRCLYRCCFGLQTRAVTQYRPIWRDEEGLYPHVSLTSGDRYRDPGCLTKARNGTCIARRTVWKVDDTELCAHKKWCEELRCVSAKAQINRKTRSFCADVWYCVSASSAASRTEASSVERAPETALVIPSAAGLCGVTQRGTRLDG